MKTLTNELSWSSSRASVFAQCKRRYYWRYYGSWGGWDRNADKQTRKAYILSKMTNLPAAVGTVVHRAIKRMIVGLMNGNSSSAESESVNARRELANMWADAKENLWHHNPKRTPPFDELYYGTTPDELELKSHGSHARKCIETFESSWLYRDLQDDIPAQWFALDQGDSFSGSDHWRVDGHRVFAIPDFGRNAGDGFEVWDWKTGQPADDHYVQLQVYGSYASEMLNAGDHGDLYAFYLGDDEIVKREFSREDNVANDVIIKGIEAMNHYADAENNPKTIEEFAMTDELDSCRRCQFRELCDRKDV